MDASRGGENKGGEGFKVGLHEPSYKVVNLRHSEDLMRLGITTDGKEVRNEANFPSESAIEVPNGEPVYEVPNPFPFWGTTYILKWQADRFKERPQLFRFKRKYREYGEDEGLFEALIDGALEKRDGTTLKLGDLPRHILLSLAQNSKKPKILSEIARISCEIELAPDNTPKGLFYKEEEEEEEKDLGPRPVIYDKPLFEVVANNPHLPDAYKRVMVLNPGAQGQNPIVGEYKAPNTHVWEYLRKNSYIPWGHYASNMAQDAVRYSVDALTIYDIKGLRFLYYQRIYTELSRALGLDPWEDINGDDHRLEALRIRVLDALKRRVKEGASGLRITGNLWGWNYGFGYASMGYRLHASHQQIHNQYALIPEKTSPPHMPTYMVGDLVWNYIESCRCQSPREFFSAYLDSIFNNKRTDGSSTGPQGLIIFEDKNVVAFCPKAQRSQGEVHLLARTPVGNVIEADTEMRRSLDTGILKVMKALSALGAEMITVYEVSKRYYRLDGGQHLFYCFLPRHEDSPGSMSEAQGRWITGHYPEDFAWLLREALKDIKMA